MQIKNLEVKELGLTVEELKARFPGLEQKFETAYKKLCYMGLQKYVPRMGYSKFSMTPYIQEGMRLGPETQVNDMEHIGWLVSLVAIFEDFFGVYLPRLYNCQPQWHSIMHGLIFHEIGEIEIGDLTDDGAFDRKEKEHKEWRVFEDFMTDFPQDAAKRHMQEFAELQDAVDYKYCFDKAAFLFAHGFFKHYFNIQGDTDGSGGYTVGKLDLMYKEKVGSPRAVDIIFAHFLDHTKKIQGPRPFLIGMTEAMYRLDFNYFDERVRGCVPGEVPPGVKQFY